MNAIQSDAVECEAETLFDADPFDQADAADTGDVIDEVTEADKPQTIPSPGASGYAVPVPMMVDTGAPPAELDQEKLFRQLVAQHQRRLYRFVIKYIDHPDDAADITQQAFAEAARTIATFRGDSKLSTWLFGIAMNMVRNYQIARYTVTGTVYSAIMKEMSDSLKGTANKIG